MAVTVSKYTARNLEAEFRLEAVRIIADPLFVRSPLQARLLRYLVRRQNDGRLPPNQYEIAFECLGRNADSGLGADCFARSQLSRLRLNLRLYYSHNIAESGMRLTLLSGSNRLELVRT